MCACVVAISFMMRRVPLLRQPWAIPESQQFRPYVLPMAGLEDMACMALGVLCTGVALPRCRSMLSASSTDVSMFALIFFGHWQYGQIFLI